MQIFHRYPDVASLLDLHWLASSLPIATVSPLWRVLFRFSLRCLYICLWHLCFVCLFVQFFSSLPLLLSTFVCLLIACVSFVCLFRFFLGCLYYIRYFHLSVLRQPREDTQPQPKRCWVESEGGSTQWEARASWWKKPQKHRRWSKEKSKSRWRSNRWKKQKLLKMGGEANLAWVYCIHPHHQKVHWCKFLKSFIHPYNQNVFWFLAQNWPGSALARVQSAVCPLPGQLHLHRPPGRGRGGGVAAWEDGPQKSRGKRLPGDESHKRGQQSIREHSGSICETTLLCHCPTTLPQVLLSSLQDASSHLSDGDDASVASYMHSFD